MFKEILEATAITLGWEFDYGREDFHNWAHKLPAFAEDQIYMFVDPITDEAVYEQSSLGGYTANRYSGRLMILRNSDLDEEYDDDAGGDGKYQLYIEPLKTAVKTGVFNFEIRCTYGLVIERWEVIEVINMFSENFDGILLNYQVLDYEINRTA